MQGVKIRQGMGEGEEEEYERERRERKEGVEGWWGRVGVSARENLSAVGRRPCQGEAAGQEERENMK